jgi:hypothetical protein
MEGRENRRHDESDKAEEEQQEGVLPTGMQPLAPVAEDALGLYSNCELQLISPSNVAEVCSLLSFLCVHLLVFYFKEVSWLSYTERCWTTGRP